MSGSRSVRCVRDARNADVLDAKNPEEREEDVSGRDGCEGGPEREGDEGGRRSTEGERDDKSENEGKKDGVLRDETAVSDCRGASFQDR